MADSVPLHSAARKGHDQDQFGPATAALQTGTGAEEAKK